MHTHLWGCLATLCILTELGWEVLPLPYMPGRHWVWVQLTLSQRQHKCWCNERLTDVTDSIREQVTSRSGETFDSLQQNLLIGEEQNLKSGQLKIKAEKGNIKHSTSPEASARLVKPGKKPKWILTSSQCSCLKELYDLENNLMLTAYTDTAQSSLKKCCHALLMCSCTAKRTAWTTRIQPASGHFPRRQHVA